MVGLFALMCLIWGATWLAMKFAVASVPPIFFAGTRFVVAGLPEDDPRLVVELAADRDQPDRVPSGGAE